jgi:hypothetical protein
MPQQEEINVPKHDKTKPLFKIFIAMLALFTVQANCNVSPTDERLPPVVNQEVLSQKQFMEQLAILNYGEIPPPWITEPAENPAEGGVITISGWGYTQSDLKSRDIPTITLSRLRPKGCSGDFDVESEIGKTQSLSNQWTFENIEVKPGEIIGAIINIEDGKKSNISNVVIISPEKLAPKITGIVQPGFTTVDQNLKIFFGEKYVPVTIEGSGAPYACIGIFERISDDDYFLRESAADSKGKWSITDIPVHDGPNIFIAKSIEGDRNGNSEGTITLFGEAGLKLQWPFGSYDTQGNFVPDLDYKNHGIRVSAWFGWEDRHWPSFHDGLDIAANGTINQGQSNLVRAIAPGCVYHVRDRTDTAGGRSVFIDHGGWASFYYHLNTIASDIKKYGPTSASNKDQSKLYCIKAGDPLGQVGTTGPGSTGVHVHIGAFIWAKGNRVNTLNKGGYYYDVKGTLINLNPPVYETINKNHTGAELWKCAGGAVNWHVDWASVEVNWASSFSKAENFKKASCTKK